MEIYDIKKDLLKTKDKLNSLKEKLEINEIKKEIKDIQQEMNKEDFWSNHQKSFLFSQKLKEKEKLISTILEIDDAIEEVNFLIKEMPSEEVEILNLYNNIDKLIENLEIVSLLNGENDSLNAYLEIHPGAGGVESHDFALMLLNMYEKYFQKKEITYKILDYNKGEVAGIKSVLIEVNGPNCFGLLKGESGVHRLIRLSPFDSDNRRHTSFASVKVTPIVLSQESTINEKDLKIDTFRSSGAGGQSVNTTDSAVRITHIPTGIVVTCQNERSQIQNKEQALKILVSKLIYLKEEEHKQKVDALVGQVKSNSFGSQKRTYTLHPYKLVKDHISNYETSQAIKVLQGEIESFIYANLIGNKK